MFSEFERVFVIRSPSTQPVALNYVDSSYSSYLFIHVDSLNDSKSTSNSN